MLMSVTRSLTIAILMLIVLTRMVVSTALVSLTIKVMASLVRVSTSVQLEHTFVRLLLTAVTPLTALTAHVTQDTWNVYEMR